MARLVLCANSQLPGIEVLMSKKDVAGAFRLLWVDPGDVELFAGDLPWVPEEMEEGEPVDHVAMTIVYLVSSFGFSGSPGEWTVWGKATEEFLRQHCPACPRRDLSWGFESRILVDDNVLVEPMVGLRPWAASEVYELGVKTLLGEAAVNREKDLIEGPFRTFQTVWGLDMDTATEEIHLPERRIVKGATLLNEPAFEYGNKDLTVRAVQRFRGIATGWTVIVKGLKNELKAADRFIGGDRDGGARVEPKVTDPADEEAIDEAWRDLWELFEESRWLCARPETWSAKFGAGMRELLPVRERLALPGEWEAGTVFVSSDATKTMIAAIDWTNGQVMRMPARAAAAWVQQCGDDDEIAIHVAEMLSFLAFACQVGATWQGKVVLYGGDNRIVREWIVGRKAGTRTGRTLVRLANLLEMRYRFTLVATWWRTFHNVHADLLTRCTDDEFYELVELKGWKVVDVIESLRQAVEDSERFGPCLLAWGEEDRRVLMQLKERRLKRALPQRLTPDWASFRAVELCGASRLVTDFVDAVSAAGGQCRRAAWSGPVEKSEVVFASLPADVRGKVLQVVTEAVVNGQGPLAVLEGPRQVPWEKATRLLEEAHWSTELNEFLTTEFGELAVRRRVCLIATNGTPLHEGLVMATSRSVLGAPMSAALKPAKAVPSEAWIYPEKIVVDAGIPREPLLPLLKGHYWLRGERFVLMSTGGPLRWPLREDEGILPCFVWDPRGPPGAVRRLSAEEVWSCQGRGRKLWDDLLHQGYDEARLLVEGSKATGGQTASALTLMAGYLVDPGLRAGGCGDAFDDLNLTKLLDWLRKWKRGLFPRARDGCRAGGADGADDEETFGNDFGHGGSDDCHRQPEAHHLRRVWRWGDGLWLDESSSDGRSPQRSASPKGDDG